MPESPNLARQQFRVLHRQFLFRMVDLELLSAHAQGDTSKLLGQLAALLVFFGVMFSIGIVAVAGGRVPREVLLVRAWGLEHSLIATTMLVVGLFAVLSWESVFPDRRDVLVLTPLPVRARTLFLAKASAAVSALGISVIALNALPGLALPFALAPPGRNVFEFLIQPALYRAIVSYWITVFAAGAFIYCSVLSVQGLASLVLSRRYFLRVSAILQMAAFCLFVSVYFLQPSLTTPGTLAAPENQSLLAWLPSYWFLGLFQELNGSAHRAFDPLARRAWIGLVLVGSGAVAAFLLSYFRTLRKIVEEPDIVPGSRVARWSPRLGNSLAAAVLLFSVRTLLRSRQHRVLLSFFWGIGLAIVTGYVKSPSAQMQVVEASATAQYQVSVPLLMSSLVMMCLAVAGTRIVFSMPLELTANWIFRIMPDRRTPEYLPAIRRSLLILGMAPVWTGSAVLFLSIWPWWPAVGHLILLGLLGVIFAELCLNGFQKIPFTCSYLPGKSNVHLVFWGFLMLLIHLIDGVARLEQRALGDPAWFALMVSILGILAICARWRTAALAKSPGAALQFEEVPRPEVQTLELRRDGVFPV